VTWLISNLGHNVDLYYIYNSTPAREPASPTKIVFSMNTLLNVRIISHLIGGINGKRREKMVRHLYRIWTLNSAVVSVSL